MFKCVGIGSSLSWNLWAVISVFQKMETQSCFFLSFPLTTDNYKTSEELTYTSCPRKKEVFANPK